MRLLLQEHWQKNLIIDINAVSGTGPGGRVIKADIQSFKTKNIENKQLIPNNIITSTEALVYEPLSQIRKTIAKNMIYSKQNAAHMTVFEELEISDLIWLREKYKKAFLERNVKLTYLPFILKATVKRTYGVSSA